MNTTEALQIECLGTTAIVSLGGDMGEFAMADLGKEVTAALRRFDQMPEIRNVVVDFRNSDYFGSSAVGFLIRLWKRVRSRGGTMALCHLSDHEREILQACRLDHLWEICASREGALAVIEAHPPTT